MIERMIRGAPGEVTARRMRHRHLPDDGKDGKVNLGFEMMTMTVREAGDIAVGTESHPIDVVVTAVVRHPPGDVPALVQPIEMRGQGGPRDVHGLRRRPTRITLLRAGRHIPGGMITHLNRAKNQPM